MGANLNRGLGDREPQSSRVKGDIMTKTAPEASRAPASPGRRAVARLSSLTSPWALTALRIGVGFILAFHGWLKLTGYDAWHDQVVQLGLPMPDVLAPLAIAGELGGGIGLMIGFLTPIAALGTLTNMLVAIFAVHLGNGLLAKDGGFEFPLTLALVSLFFVLRGAGRFSVDEVLFGRWLTGSAEARRASLHLGERPARAPA